MNPLIYIFIFSGPTAPTIHPENWKPWINCADREEAVNLAAHQYIRQRGKPRPGDAPHNFTVCAWEECDAVRENGNPFIVKTTEFTVYPK